MIWYWVIFVLVFSLSMRVVATFATGPQVAPIKEPSQFELMKMSDQMDIEVHLKDKDKFTRFEGQKGEAGGTEKENQPKSKTQLRWERQSSSNTLNSKLGSPNSVKDHTIMTTIWKHEN